MDIALIGMRTLGLNALSIGKKIPEEKLLARRRSYLGETERGGEGERERESKKSTEEK